MFALCWIKHLELYLVELYLYSNIVGGGGGVVGCDVSSISLHLKGGSALEKAALCRKAALCKAAKRYSAARQQGEWHQAKLVFESWLCAALGKAVLCSSCRGCAFSHPF